VKHDGETNEGCGGEGAGCDQHEAAVELGLCAQVDRQGKGDGEGCQVQESDPEQGALPADSGSSRSSRRMVTAVTVPITGMATPRATPNQPSRRCLRTLPERTRADWTI
jgi:hypothetical protein